jgi:hypothetical protein
MPTTIVVLVLTIAVCAVSLYLPWDKYPHWNGGTPKPAYRYLFGFLSGWMASNYLYTHKVVYAILAIAYAVLFFVYVRYWYWVKKRLAKRTFDDPS